MSERMMAMAGMVSEGHRLADVGCDHGYLPIYLCSEGRIPSALAMDVHPGPLSRAREHIEQYGMEGRIETRLSDGLDALGEDEADTLLLAGMGGMLIKRILGEGPIPVSITELVLQPQSDMAAVRRCVREIGFRIVDEDMVCEDGKYYPMMKAARGAAAPLADPDREELEDVFGPVLLATSHPVLRQYLARQRAITEDILRRLAPSSARYHEVLHTRELISAAIESVNGCVGAE